MKTWLSCTLAAIIGFTAAWILGSFSIFDTIIGYATGILLNIGTFILLPLVFVTLMAATASLRKDKGSIGPVYLVSTAWSLFTAIALSILAGVAFMLLPSDFPMATGTKFTTDTSLAESLTTSIFTMFSRYNPIANSPFMNLIVSPTWLLPIAFTAFIFGFVLKPDNDAIRPAYVVMNSFSEIMFRLSRAMACISWLFVAFFSAYWFKAFKTSEILTVPNFAIFIGVAVASAILVLIPILFWFFTGFKGNPYKLIARSLGVSLTGLFSTNMLLAMTGTYHISRRNLGVEKRVTSTVLPFSTFFTRGGTAMISTICLCALCTRANIAILDFRSISLIAIFCTAFSLLCSINLGFETVFVTVLAANALGYNLGGIEVLIIGLLPLVNGLGIFVDMILSSLGTYVSGKAINAISEVPFKETL
ncbi:MAG: cation:dicarboxylase symporter family transporter [Sphaerochaetaceae bacterium]|jgi:Na+/H+-dicarboxylate symporter|nr:cation:dicarboxylase symporter family transporter [Sphaerochaetaceae bacterium]